MSGDDNKQEKTCQPAKAHEKPQNPPEHKHLVNSWSSSWGESGLSSSIGPATDVKDHPAQHIQSHKPKSGPIAKR